MKNEYCQIIIRKNEVSADLKGLSDNEITHLHIFTTIKSDLSLLEKYPNLTHLSLSGSFFNLSVVSKLKFVKSLDLRLKTYDNDLLSLMSENLEYLHLSNIKNLKSLDFIEEAVNLKKLYLESLAGVTELPQFNKMHSLYALKIYELHKLINIDGLINSYIRFMDLALAADKISSTKISEVILQMDRIEQLNINFLDRGSFRRYDVIEKNLRKSEIDNILNDKMDYDSWIKL